MIIEPNSNQSSSTTTLPSSIAVSEINGGNSTVINSGGSQVSSASVSSSNKEALTVTYAANSKQPQTTANNPPPTPIAVAPVVIKPLSPPQPIVVLDDTHNKVSLAKQQKNLAAVATPIASAAATTKPNPWINIKASPLPSPSSALKSGAKINGLLSKLDNQLKNSGISSLQGSLPTNLNKALPTASLLPISLSF